MPLYIYRENHIEPYSPYEGAPNKWQKFNHFSQLPSTGWCTGHGYRCWVCRRSSQVQYIKGRGPNMSEPPIETWSNFLGERSCLFCICSGLSQLLADWLKRHGDVCLLNLNLLAYVGLEKKHWSKSSSIVSERTTWTRVHARLPTCQLPSNSAPGTGWWVRHHRWVCAGQSRGDEVCNCSWGCGPDTSQIVKSLALWTRE